MKTTLNKIKKKCEEEITWAQANIDEMELPGNYKDKDNDLAWFSGWINAHRDILNIITSQAKTTG